MYSKLTTFEHSKLSRVGVDFTQFRDEILKNNISFEFVDIFQQSKEKDNFIHIPDNFDWNLGRMEHVTNLLSSSTNRFLVYSFEPSCTVCCTQNFLTSSSELRWRMMSEQSEMFGEGEMTRQEFEWCWITHDCGIAGVGANCVNEWKRKLSFRQVFGKAFILFVLKQKLFCNRLHEIISRKPSRSKPSKKS